MERIKRRKTSVLNKLTPSNNPEDGRILLDRGASLRSRVSFPRFLFLSGRRKVIHEVEGEGEGEGEWSNSLLGLFSPRERTPIPIEPETEWTPDPFRLLCRREEYLVAVVNRTLAHLVRSLACPTKILQCEMFLCSITLYCDCCINSESLVLK
jgi:hypothetical protein